MSAQDKALRSVELARVERGRYEATNVRGGVLPVGDGSTEDFTPVELLLAALAGCSAIDVDMITGKRAEPETFAVTATGEKVRDTDGNHLTELLLRFEVTFPEDAGGDAAREVLPTSIERSRDRLCTVSRTVALGTPVAMALGDQRL